MAPSLRPLIYTWGAILAGVGGGAAALQIIGPPQPPDQAKASVPIAAPSAPVAPVMAALAPAPSDLAAASPTVTPTDGVEALPAGPPPALPQALPATSDRSARRDSLVPDGALIAPKKSSPERHRSVAALAAKPLLQEGVPIRKPRFIGVYVTDADGTRSFRALP